MTDDITNRLIAEDINSWIAKIEDFQNALCDELTTLGFELRRGALLDDMGHLEMEYISIQKPTEVFVTFSAARNSEELISLNENIKKHQSKLTTIPDTVIVTPITLKPHQKTIFSQQNIFFAVAVRIATLSAQAEIVAEIIKTQTRAHSNFIGSDTILGEEFVTHLCRALEECGFQMKREFLVPFASTRGKGFRVDIYITSPIRAFIELFSGKRIKRGRASPFLLKHKMELIEKVSSEFDRQIVPILITRGKLGEYEQKIFKGQRVVFVNLEEEGSAEKIACIAAKKINDSLLNSDWGRAANLTEKITKVEYLRPLEGLSQFGDILVSLRPLMTAEHFNLVLEEVQEFNEEFDSKHFTSATLRVGRTLEYVVYILAQSWEVKIDNASFKRLSALQGAMDQLKKHFIQYVYEEKSERSQQRKVVKDKIKSIQDQITDLAMNIDDDHEVSDQIIPVNIQTIIRDAGKKYARHKEIREALETLVSNPAIDRLLTMRNRSAHANIDLQGKQFEESEILQMIADLKSVIFALCNISTAIANLRE